MNLIIDEFSGSTVHDILRPALSDLKIIIHDQIAEEDKVTTRNQMGVAATGKSVTIDVRVSLWLRGEDKLFKELFTLLGTQG